MNPQVAKFIEVLKSMDRVVLWSRSMNGSGRCRMTAVFLPLLVLVATLFAGCLTSVPLPGPGDGTSVFVHPITGEVKHCADPGLPAVFRGGVLWRRMLTPDCTAAAEKQGYVSAFP